MCAYERNKCRVIFSFRHYKGEKVHKIYYIRIIIIKNFSKYYKSIWNIESDSLQLMLLYFSWNRQFINIVRYNSYIIQSCKSLYIILYLIITCNIDTIVNLPLIFNVTSISINELGETY